MMMMMMMMMMMTMEIMLYNNKIKMTMMIMIRGNGGDDVGDDGVTVWGRKFWLVDKEIFVSNTKHHCYSSSYQHFATLDYCGSFPVFVKFAGLVLG